MFPSQWLHLSRCFCCSWCARKTQTIQILQTTIGKTPATCPGVKRFTFTTQAQPESRFCRRHSAHPRRLAKWDSLRCSQPVPPTLIKRELSENGNLYIRPWRRRQSNLCTYRKTLYHITTNLVLTVWSYSYVSWDSKLSAHGSLHLSHAIAVAPVTRESSPINVRHDNPQS